MNKKKLFSPATLMIILGILFFGGIGIFFASYQLKYYDEVTIGFYLYTMAILVVSLPIHVILHELGHLLAGSLSGYDFIMFRLFNLVWIQTDEGLSRRKQHVPGILGQALMIPPENSDTEAPPFLLYHLGGVLMNGLTAGLFFFIGKSLANPWIVFFFYLSAVLAVFLIVINLLPFKGTDGYNILSYLKNPNQEDEILTLLHLYHDMVKGLSFRAIEKSIEFNPVPDFSNPNTVTLHSIRAAAALETDDFETAREMYAVLWENIDQLVEPHKVEVGMSYLFTLLLTEPSHPHVQAIQTSPFYKSYRKVKQADSYRLFAAEALYLEQEDEKARELLEKGKKEIPFSPTITDENLERQLYEYLNTELERQ